jgi:uncharacterized membrane protein
MTLDHASKLPRVLLPKDKRQELSPVLVLTATFFVFTLIFSLNRYLSFYASLDHGIFNQIFWNGLHGQFFQSSLSSTLSDAVVNDGHLPLVFYHRLGQHFTPALLLWLPLYALFPTGATLVWLHVTLATAGGWVLYVLARHYLKPAIALMITAGYYGSIALIGTTLSNFHDLCQIPLFVFTLLLALEKRWWWLFWTMAALTLLVREDAGVGLFGIGIYLIWSRRYPWRGLLLAALSMGYILLATNVLMPLFSDDVSQRFMIERFGQFTETTDASTLDILKGIASNPGKLIAYLFRKPDQKVLYLLAETLSLSFVPLLSPVSWTIAGFPLLQIFLQQGSSATSIYIRYVLTLVPGLFYGTILWWAAHDNAFKPRFRSFWKGLIILSVLIVCLYSPNRTFYFLIPDSFKPWVYVSLGRQWEHAGQIRSLIQQIPADASVSSTVYLAPHLSTRREVLKLPFLKFINDQQQVDKVDYILADLWQLQQYQVAFKSDRQYLETFVSLIDQTLSQKQYGIQALKDGVILMQKDVRSQPGLLEAWKELRQGYTN